MIFWKKVKKTLFQQQIHIQTKNGTGLHWWGHVVTGTGEKVK